MKLFVVSSISCDGYDSYEVSYHLTRKGALKYIMQRHYENWDRLRYVVPMSYDELDFYIQEKELNE